MAFIKRSVLSELIDSKVQVNRDCKTYSTFLFYSHLFSRLFFIFVWLKCVNFLTIFCCPFLIWWKKCKSILNCKWFICPRNTQELSRTGYKVHMRPNRIGIWSVYLFLIIIFIDEFTFCFQIQRWMRELDYIYLARQINWSSFSILCISRR